MLTGETPFHGANPFAIMNARLSEPPRPPSEINPAIPPELDTAILRALELDPNQRHTTAQEFAYSLSHPAEVPFARSAPATCRTSRSLKSYLIFALIPVVLFALLLYVARAG